MLFESLDAGSVEAASTVCLGSGRFLRTVLVPALAEVTTGDVVM